jgi:hypothetical protein
MSNWKLKSYYYFRNGMFRIPGGRLLHDKIYDGALQLREGGSFPTRRVTNGPGFYWRGYYDKLLFDSANRFLLVNRSDFENRSPRADDKISIGMVDLEDGDRWIDLGQSNAWNWQQGCMLQWVPGSKSTVVWNDRQGDRFVSHFLNVQSMEKFTLPHPIYCLSPDGQWALSTDFRRLHDERPGYGYAGIIDPNRDIPAPEDSGVWKINLATGKAELIISIAQVAALDHIEPFPKNAKHRLEHLLFNPTGDRFLFLHRWSLPDYEDAFFTRMITARPDGTDMFVVDPFGKTSHFDWRDSENILAWTWHPDCGNAFLLFKDRCVDYDVLGKDIMTVNGHPTYLPNEKRHWIINDTYPDQFGNQKLFLFNTASGNRRAVGIFKALKGYAGEWRCDLHPAASADGLKISIDSTHEGAGRQVYLVELPQHIF